MRVWIAHLISNSNALNDFRLYTTEIIANLNKRLTTLVRDGKLDEARSVAYEIKVYEDLRKVVSRELQEQRSQTDYINETKGEL